VSESAPRVAAVIPAYDADATLAAVVVGLRRAIPRALIVVVDDGSRDRTAEVAAAHADRLVGFDRNRGKGAALRAGFAAALAQGAAALVTLDADGQHDPAFAPALLAALADADVVVGVRGRRGSDMPLARRATNALSARAVSACAGQPIADAQSGFRALSRRVVEAVDAEGDRYEFETDFLIRAARAGYRIAGVPVPTAYGAPSHFRLLQDGMLVTRSIWRHRQGAGRNANAGAAAAQLTTEPR
jgi:hypothetical protein